jgi:type I restriction enzyme S subunit
LIATNCIRNDALYPTHEKLRYVSLETYNSWFRSHPIPGDIIFVNKGTPGRVCLVPDPVDFVIAQDMVAVRANDSRVYPRFLFAALRSPEVQDRVRQMHVGTMIPHFKKTDFARLMIPLPSSRKLQEFVGDAYFAFSAKVDLNLRRSRAAEAIAEALFHSWFVDFDPVVAKAEGRHALGVPEDAHLAMADGFDVVDGTTVPRGWTVGSVYDVADVVYGLPFASTMFNSSRSGRPLLRIRDLPSGDPQVFTTEQHPREVVIRAGDIVVGMDGEFRAYLWRGPDALLNQRVCQFRPRAGVSSSFVLFSIGEPLAHFERANVGTTVNHLGKRDIDTIRLIVPSDAVLSAFGRLTTPLLTRVVANDAESRALVLLRDTLLPQLLNGAVSLREAERAVGLAV